MKKISLILAILTVLTILCSCREKVDESLFSYEAPDTSGPEDAGTYYYGFTYIKYEGSHIAISDYNGADKNMNIPAEINGLPVTEIIEKAFEDNDYVTSVTIPESVVKIGADAFSDCSALGSVTVKGASLKTVGDHAFFNTPYLTGNTEEFLIIGDGILIDYSGSSDSASVPEGVKMISGAFENEASLTQITLPESLTSIGGYSFNGCLNLKSVNIPSSVTEIGQWAFAKCAALESITLPDSVTSIGPKCFLLCEGLKDVTLSAGIRGIPNSAFQSCRSLTEVTLPSSVISIDENAFIRCSSLESVNIEGDLISIGPLAFSECSAGLTVCSAAGSYAEEYCGNYGIAFTAK